MEVEIQWGQNMIDSNGELLEGVGVFKVLGYKWAVVDAYFESGKKFFRVLHYKTGAKTGFCITTKELEFVTQSFKRWMEFKGRIDDLELKISNLPEQN